MTAVDVFCSPINRGAFFLPWEQDKVTAPRARAVTTRIQFTIFAVDLTDDELAAKKWDTVGDVRRSIGKQWGIPSNAVAILNKTHASDALSILPGDRLEFIRPR